MNSFCFSLFYVIVNGEHFGFLMFVIISIYYFLYLLIKYLVITVRCSPIQMYLQQYEKGSKSSHLRSEKLLIIIK